MKNDFACMPYLPASRHAALLLAFDDADQRGACYRPGKRAVVALIEICVQSSRTCTSGGGVHVFFKSTELSRAMFPTTSKAPDIDIITGTGHNVNVAPSGNKRWVVGFCIFDAAPPPIPDKLVRLLEEACIQLKAELQAAKAAKHATDATGIGQGAHRREAEVAIRHQHGTPGGSPA